jgi:hypothetical protein
MSGAIVTWQSKLDATNGIKPVAHSHIGGVHYEDYELPDGYWRYTWTNFTLDDHPEFIEVNLMEYGV